MADYIRVLPRDLFNEANLLKCLGRLWIAVERADHKARFITEDCDRFDIQQEPSDGSISVANIVFEVHGRRCHLARPLNSRRSWPLYLSVPDDPDQDVIPVFDEAGNLSREMLTFMIFGSA